MNKILFRLIAIAVIVLSVHSCKRDPCRSTNCLNGGICKDGTCDCLSGYEGTDCGTESTAKFIGNYSVTDNINFTKSANNIDDPDSVFTKTYSVSVAKGNDFGSLLIHNADNNNGNYVYTTVDKSNLTVTNRPFYMTIKVAHTYDVSATGSMSGNTITIAYSVSGYYGSATITSVLVKQ
ncbi:MAG: calcium-binding EGF-like domain-containing protein [Bacteroidetes bacterium]|nr:calcium-binding EGF-like domain-containing protein [Bacteroidota bacterium]